MRGNPDSQNARPAVLLLAAGRARRFGSDKRRALVNGRLTLLEQCLQPYLDAGLALYVAISSRPQDDALAAQLALRGVMTLRCMHADAGMGSTIAECLPTLKNFSGLFIALADMPLLRLSTLAALESEFAPGRIVYPSFAGKRGHPVLFSSSFYPALSQLQGERGGARVIDESPAASRAVSVDDPGVLFDVDTRDDLERLAVMLNPGLQ